jgi:hypothetical protein
MNSFSILSVEVNFGSCCYFKTKLMLICMLIFPFIFCRFLVYFDERINRSSWLIKSQDIRKYDEIRSEFFVRQFRVFCVFVLFFVLFFSPFFNIIFNFISFFFFIFIFIFMPYAMSRRKIILCIWIQNTKNVFDNGNK